MRRKFRGIILLILAIGLFVITQTTEFEEEIFRFIESHKVRADNSAQTNLIKARSRYIRNAADLPNSDAQASDG
jgi:hypothetical protein